MRKNVQRSKVDVTFLNRLFLKQDLFSSLFHRSLDPPTRELVENAFDALMRAPKIAHKNVLPKQTNWRWRLDSFSLGEKVKGTEEESRMAQDGPCRDFGEVKENVRGLWASKSKRNYNCDY
jgi:hypothetical protein